VHQHVTPEQALRDSEARLRAIVDTAVDGIITIDEGGTIEWLNRAAQRTFGYEAHELIGRNVKLLMPDPYHAEHDRYLDNYRRTGERKIIGIGREVVGRRKDGTTFSCDLSVSEVHLGDRRIFTGIIRDISERKRAEQAVRDSEARIKAIVDTAVDGIITIDEQGTIEWLNPAAINIFGYSWDELIGRNVKMLMPEPYHGEHDGYLRNYVRTGERRIIGIGREVVGRRKDGSTFPMDLAVSEVLLGERRLFTGIVRDITQRKAAEQELLRAKEAAETASRAKDQFIAAVSHELRTPLNPIMATARLLKQRGDLPDEVKQDLHVIHRNAAQEARLVDDLLHLTRLARGKIELHNEVVDVHALLRNVVGQFQEHIDVRHIDLLIGLRAERRHVWADPGRLQQVVANLLDNAVKFSEPNGRISVRTANTGDGHVRIEISDSGIGIEPQVLPRLFNPFEQGETTVTRKYGGLGMGLVISKGIVDLHRGKLTAHSDGRGQGATFTLDLPVMAAVPEVAHAAPALQLQPKPAGVAFRVLLVEDHFDTLKVMERLLASFGCNVTTAMTVRQALEAAGKEHFDLLVSDIGLPDGSGIELMRRLGQEQQIKGIALSGFGQEDDLRRSKEAGFVEHLVKPVNFDLLHDVIQKVAG
jgi:PAS domain S-box-containing protein